MTEKGKKEKKIIRESKIAEMRKERKENTEIKEKEEKSKMIIEIAF